MSHHQAQSRGEFNAIRHDLEELRLIAEMKKKDKDDKRKLKELEKKAGVDLKDWLDAQSKHKSKKERKRQKKEQEKIQKLLQFLRKRGFLKK